MERQPTYPGGNTPNYIINGKRLSVFSGLPAPLPSSTSNLQERVKKLGFVPLKPIMVERDDCTWYVPNYCEENCYRLAKVFRELTSEAPFDVVFVSNKPKRVPLWSQSTAPNPNSPVIWDYHVIIILTVKNKDDIFETHVYDQDSKLAFPTPFPEFVQKVLRPEKVAIMSSQYQRKFRLVTGDDFIKHFASDRSHMKTADGKWSSPPPETVPIRTAVSTNNLQRYIDMEHDIEDSMYGRVLDEEDFIDQYSWTKRDLK